jgi:transposase
MTTENENETMGILLDIPQLQVDAFRVEQEERKIHVDCSSIFEEALCPHCLKKTGIVNQTRIRHFRDFPIAGKEVYLHLSQRQFYCPHCDKYFHERFNNIFGRQRRMMSRYEQYIYKCCKANSIQNVSVQENLVWATVNEIYQYHSRQELKSRSATKIRAVGMDEFAIKKGHGNYATVIVDLERVEIIDILDYRDQARLIEYFKSKGIEWCEGIEVFCSDMWQGFINTAKAVFPNATLVVDRFHFYSHLNKAVDGQRKNLRRLFKDEEDFKNLKWLLLKNGEDLTPEQKKKLDRTLLRSPQLKLIYDHKEKFREIFNQNLTREQGQIELDKWIESAKKMNNKYMNKFLNTLNNWKDYILNYFVHRVTTSVIEGINNSIKTMKRIGYGFRNFANFKHRVLMSFA